jgi:hypothetical protein
MTNKDRDTVYKKYGYDKDKIPFPMMQIGEEDEVAINPYSEVKVTLNPVEIAIYDCLMGSYHAHLLAGDTGNMETAKSLYDDYYKGKDWFIENNPDAYFKLID